MLRRKFLASIAASLPTVLAGCTQTDQVENRSDKPPIAWLTMKRVTDSEIGNLSVDYRYDSLSQNQRTLIGQTITNNSTTGRSKEPAIHANKTVMCKNRVYRISHERIDSQQAYSYAVTLNRVDKKEINETEIIKYSKLPAVDRQKFVENRLDDSDFGSGTGLTYTDSELNQSVLVPNTSKPIIVWPKGQTGRFNVIHQTRTSLITYRYTAADVAPTVTTYGQQIRNRYAFRFDNLSTAERAIIEKVISSEDKYIIDSQANVPAGLTSLADKFRKHVPVRGTQSASGIYLLEYNGKLYWTGFYIDSQRLSVDSRSMNS